MAYIGKQPTPVPLSASDLDDDIISLAKMAGGTDGNLISYDTSGNPVAVATGSDGQVLTSAGAGNPCLFEAAAAGGSTTFLERQTASTASTVDFDGNFTSDYTNYILYFSNIFMSTDAQMHLRVRQSDTAMTNNYYDSSGLMNHRTSGANTVATNGSFNDFGAGYLHKYNIEGAVGEPSAGHLYIYNPLNATGGKCFTGNFVTQEDNTSTNNQNSSIYWDENTNALSGISIITSSGTISGFFDLYGIKNSA
jgi:hypothetical protein